VFAGANGASFNPEAMIAQIRSDSGIADFIFHGVRHLVETKLAELKDASGRPVASAARPFASRNWSHGKCKMTADKHFEDAKLFADKLRELHAERRGRVLALRAARVRRRALTRADRDELLRKTDKRCHICGGIIDGNDWEADHVLAHGSGGAHAIDNYLPAHSLCNNYRWHYDAEEFQWILKLGV
jgi:5-methylcytosine-specific restriction endonuclease McrA